jgi:hypothetical protein
MNVKAHKKSIVIFFGLIVILYLAKTLGVLNEKLAPLYETKIMKMITNNVISLALALLGAWIGTGGSPDSRDIIDFGISPDIIVHGCKRGKLSHSFVIPSIMIMVSILVPEWIKPLLTGYQLGYSAHVILDFICNSNAFVDRRFVVISFVAYLSLMILFEFV